MCMGVWEPRAREGGEHVPAGVPGARLWGVCARGGHA